MLQNARILDVPKCGGVHRPSSSQRSDLSTANSVQSGSFFRERIVPIFRDVLHPRVPLHNLLILGWLPERSERRGMEARRAPDPTGQTRRRQAHGEHPRGCERRHVRSVDWLPMASNPERPAATLNRAWLFRFVGLGRHAGPPPSRTLREVSRSNWP